MKRRGPIRYRLREEEPGKKPTAEERANLFSIDEIMANPDASASAQGEPNWYILRVQPGGERLAAAHLAGRRFGVFVPERRSNKALMPGYVFVYSRNIAEDHSRIVGFPGAIEVMQYPGTGLYAHVQITDEQGVTFRAFDAIDKIRVMENYARSEIGPEDIAYMRPPKRRRRPRRSKKLHRRSLIDRMPEAALYVESTASCLG